VRRAAADALDGALHERRRSLALARLRGAPPTSSVLFVCTGNVYRSPFAAHAFARALPPALQATVEVRSAGFVSPGRQAPPDAQEAATRYGLELESHVSARVTGAQVHAAGLVVVMEPWQQRELSRRFGPPLAHVLLLGDLDPLPVTSRSIPDPWAGGAGVLDASYARIERCVAVLADEMASAHGHAAHEWLGAALAEHG
jgi:protein-tyrosine phosphatase